MREDVLPIILGANEGAYALSNAFYHDYGIIPLVFDSKPSALFSATACAYFVEFENIRKKDILYRTLDDIHSKKQGKSLILIPADKEFLSFVREREEWLSKMFLLPHLPTPCADKIPEDLSSLTLLYRAGKGECRTVFGRVLSLFPSGKAGAVLTENIPADIEENIEREAQGLSRGIYLFYIGADGVLYRDGSVLSPLCAFAAAKDASIPEWIIEETVLCNPLTETQKKLFALFTLFPYRKCRRFLSRKDRKSLRRVEKCALYGFKTEGFRKDIARIFKELYRSYARH